MEAVGRFFENIVSRYNTPENRSKKTLAVGIFFYTVFFAAFFSFTILPSWINAGSITGFDSIAQYYPYLKDFRRSISTIFDGIAGGSPVFPMMNFDFAFGSDMYLTSTGDFLPLLPYYIFLPLIPEDGLLMFYSVATLILLYTSGITFILMCRHFDAGDLSSAFFAPFYVMCGNCFYTAALNQQFLFMYVAFPLIIIGMDNIIRGKGIKLFVLSVTWLFLGSMIYIIYTIPFVVLFAAIRVFYVYKGRYFVNLLKYFLLGCSLFLLACLITGFEFVPAMNNLLTGSRHIGEMPAITGLLIPSTHDLAEALVPYSPTLSTGICAAVIPALIFLLVIAEDHRELKCYGLIMLLLISLPVIRYGLNGFGYSICRWGFIPAALMCFTAARVLPQIFRLTKRQLIVYAVVIFIYAALALTQNFQPAAVFITAAGVITFITPVRKAAVKLLNRLADGYNALRGKEQAFRIVSLSIITVSVLAVLIAAAIALSIARNTALCIGLACVFTVVAGIAAYRWKKAAAVLASAAICIYTLSGFMYYNNLNIEYTKGIDLPQLEYLSRLEKETDKADTFGRMNYIYSEWQNYMEYTTERGITFTDADAEETTEDTGENKGDVDDQFDLALRYEMPDINIFQSVIDGDIMNFVERCGQDSASVYSTVDMDGFSGKEVMYSLFGVRYLYNGEPYDLMYGTELFRNENIDGMNMHIYLNKYALPVGVTYSGLMSRERYESFDQVETPFAFMNEVYLEGSPLSDNAADSAAVYSRRCDIIHESSSRGTTSYGIECKNNTISISDDTSGCFVFLCFDGVKSSIHAEEKKEPFYIDIDRKMTVIGQIHNQNSSWPWAYSNDHYAFELGYFENGVKDLEFITPFEYENVYVSAVPASIMTDAYEERTREILKNVRTDVNTLTGDITVSDNKVLSVNIIHSDGWKAYVDGKETPIYKANGLFLGIPLEKGTHTVELRYTTPYLYEGLVVSAAGIAVFIIVCIIYKRKVLKKGKPDTE